MEIKKQIHMKNLKQFSKALLEDGGATFNLVSGEHDFKGYAYSIYGHEKIHNTLEGMFTISEVEQAVKTFVRENGVELYSADNHLGGWFDKGKLYLDITNVTSDLRNAVVKGLRNNQKAIHDFRTGKDIHLPKGQGAGTMTQKATYLEMKIDELVSNHKNK
mgnify:CR=1 FL=1